MTSMIKCPLCGKEYADVPGVDKWKRLGGHLTGKHGLKGDRYWKALGLALKEFHERSTGKKIEVVGP